MGTNSTFMFLFHGSLYAIRNPIIPQENEYFSSLFGQYFSKGLDEIGSLYFTKELFDKTYPGYSSSYADLWWYWNVV